MSKNYTIITPQSQDIPRFADSFRLADQQEQKAAGFEATAIAEHMSGWSDSLLDALCQQLHEEIQQPEMFFHRAALIGRRIVGLCTGLYRTDNARGRLTTLWVDEDSRRLDIGSNLLDSFERACREHDSPPPSIHFGVLETNIGAIKFYQSRGYDLTGESYPAIFGKQATRALAMQKLL